MKNCKMNMTENDARKQTKQGSLAYLASSYLDDIYKLIDKSSKGGFNSCDWFFDENDEYLKCSLVVIENTLYDKGYKTEIVFEDNRDLLRISW